MTSRRHSSPSQAPQASHPRPRVRAATPGAGISAASGVRLSKVMADRGMCSRREADALIEKGWVFVDGERVAELGTRIRPDARITLAPEARARQARQVTLLLHKPVGYVSGQPEPGFKPALALITATRSCWSCRLRRAVCLPGSS